MKISVVLFVLLLLIAILYFYSEKIHNETENNYLIIDAVNELKILEHDFDDFLNNRETYDNYDEIKNRSIKYSKILDILTNHEIFSLSLLGNKEITEKLKLISTQFNNKNLIIEHYKSASSIVNNSQRYLTSLKKEMLNIAKKNSDNNGITELILYFQNTADDLSKPIDTSKLEKSIENNKKLSELKDNFLTHNNIIRVYQKKIIALQAENSKLDILKNINKLDSLLINYFQKRFENQRLVRSSLMILLIAASISILFIYTKEKQTQKQFHYQSNFLNHFLNSGDDTGFIGLDIHNNIKYINDYAKKIISNSNSDLLDMPFDLDLCKNSNIQELEKVKTAISKDYILNETFLTLDNRFINIKLNAIKNNLGEKLGQQIILKDITERLEFQQNLELSEKVFYHSHDGIFLTDKNTNILRSNPSFTRIAGYKESEIVGKTPKILKSEKQDENFYKDFWKCLNNDGYWSGEMWNKRKDGSLYPIKMTITAVYEDQGNLSHYIAITNDISDRIEKEKRIESERQLKVASEAAKKSNEMKSIFLANMSHEIRTPLNAILGFTDILSTNLKEEDNIKYLNYIQTSGKTLLTLINDILDLSKIEAGKLDLNYKELPVRTLLAEMETIFSQVINEKALTYNTSIAADVPPLIEIDEIRLRQILLNVIGNAVKYTEKGSISISLKTKNYNELTKTTDLVFSIQDSGIGIQRESINEIFGIFDRDKSKKSSHIEGTGLGLAITKRLLEMMNGMICVDSELGKGSTFTFVLHNISFSDENIPFESKEKNYNLQENYDLKKSKVLVVDDVQHNREIVKHFLQSLNAQVLEAVDGIDCINKIQKDIPELIFLDLKMPKMNGYEVVQYLKASQDFKNIPIVALTASTMTHTENATKDLFDDYIRKPVSKEEIIKVMMKYYSKKNLNNALPKNFEDEKIINLNILYDEMTSELFNQWEQVSKVFIMKDVNQFIDKIIQLGDKHQFNNLKDWGYKIQETSKSFNTVKLKNELQSYPEFIDTIASRIKT